MRSRAYEDISEIDKGEKIMDFYNKMFNPNYVNQAYYNQMQQKMAQHQFEQDKEVLNAVKACHDMLEAVKKLDAQHQQQAYALCLAEIAKAQDWNNY